MHHVSCQVLIKPVNQILNINFQAVNCINQAMYLVHVLATGMKNVIVFMFSSRLRSKIRAQIQTSRPQRKR